jgi:hypothetical protein
MAFKVRFSGQGQPADYGDDDGLEFLAARPRQPEGYANSAAGPRCSVRLFTTTL